MADDQEQTIGLRLGRILQVSLGVGIALILAGSILSFLADGHLPVDAVALRSLPSPLLQGHGDAWLTLGILTLLAGPAIGLIYLAGAYFLRQDRRFALIALGVLAIMLVSLPIAMITQGS